MPYGAPAESAPESLAEAKAAAEEEPALMAAAAVPLECLVTANTGPEEAGAVHLPDLPLPVLMQEMVQRVYAGVLLQPLVTRW